ncbi:hypothetical protein ACHMW6_04170 [Pseudoduganella sp. UC29_106]|uniref:hypothetical protein n=1 Tax=Pseudoduganella sp. UC29_106 TaxID=3374553 RepID=UPI003757BD16
MTTFSTIRVPARISAPEMDSSPPDSDGDTASLSSMTTSRSKGVNWPTVRLPVRRTMISSAP